MAGAVLEKNIEEGGNAVASQTEVQGADWRAPKAGESIGAKWGGGRRRQVEWGMGGVS